ncbi:FAD-dependent oxidoreductase [Rhodococcus sp. WS3]|uniref:FAD-dependent oxidoreductase n=1 Tax=Rhodococcus sp. WS3 TaxID=2486271 RepID=UPI0011443F77|nr:FAD-dependent oxidoreductase [Rhodococcus sp. WS3]ROZ49664.1 FAD-dependent oxidoreductase [Rhodococcus sp. WS3]
MDNNVDVIVIGSGAAGSAAALQAHADGASVVILEKCGPDNAGGNTRLSGGGWFVNQDPAAARTFLRALNGSFTVADDVIDAWAENTHGLSDWLRELDAPVSMSGEFHSTAEYAELDGSSCYAGMDTIGGAMGNELLYRFLVSALAERGITTLFDTEATALLTDESGAVIGVETVSGGTTSQMYARRGVILATGGFEANPAMVRDYLRLENPKIWGSPSATGDGHRMAQAVGADLWHMNNMMTITGISGDTDDPSGHYLALWNAHNYVFLSQEGRRFTCESAEMRHGHVFKEGSYQHFPVRSMNIVFDESMRLAGPLSPGRDVLAVGRLVLDEGYEWSADNQTEIDKGWIVKADTLAELADKLGLDPAVVETSVRRYNEACTAGVDESFGRDPATLAPVVTAPFYAVSGPPLLGWSNGGPRRDGHSRVLDTAGNPISGLYAAGTVSSTYSAAKDGGFHIADALAFGRVAGAHAATRVSADA